MNQKDLLNSKKGIWEPTRVYEKVDVTAEPCQRVYQPTVIFLQWMVCMTATLAHNSDFSITAYFERIGFSLSPAPTPTPLKIHS